MKWVIVLIFFVILPLAMAAELKGSIYDENLNTATNVLVEVDTTPLQRMLSTDGAYAFTLLPGNYTITATYAAGTVNRTSTEHILIAQDGSFTFDLFLFPDLDAFEIVDDLEIEDALLDDAFLEQGTSVNEVSDIFRRLLIIVIVMVFAYLSWRTIQRRLNDTMPQADDLAQEVLKFIDKEGGRVTQKELRKQFLYSEAKMSLVVTELEANGKLQKIKKGRGNILVRK